MMVVRRRKSIQAPKDRGDGPDENSVSDEGGSSDQGSPEVDATEREANLDGKRRKRKSESEVLSVRSSAKTKDGLPSWMAKGTAFNTHDIMFSPTEKSLKILDKILRGEGLFTM